MQRCPPAPVHYYVTHPRVPAAVIQQLENSLAVEWNFIIVSSVQLMLSASLLLTADLLAPCSSVYIYWPLQAYYTRKYDFHAFDYDY